ncbi:hypothetical protein Fcan01_27449 [Folsomia candida]|uniref:Uncharacterized protein n=1 Tax=Folsomia candida TaxID=158441 RepID=A0A226CXS3_FOLCA|nr:hypothetical protein Fcan01_27449 [Folsomia candida]
MEDPQEATITELFGVLLAYTEIMEKHVLFGKCPFHWNKNDQRPHVRFEIFGCFKFWIKLVILTATLAIPCNLIILRFLINKFALFGYCFEDNLPINFISTNISCAVVVGTILLIFLPVMAFWESMAVPEIERTFGIFQRLRKVCPKEENGSSMSATFNSMATTVFRIYVKLPIFLTLVGIYLNLDPLYYFFRQMSIFPTTDFVLPLLFRIVSLFASFTEVCRLMALIISAAMLVINIGKRETHMWRRIAGLSTVRGLYFHKQIAVLYSARRIPAMCLLTLIVLVCLVLQVSSNYATLAMLDLLPFVAYIVFPYIAGVAWIVVTSIVDTAAQVNHDFDTGLELMRVKCLSRKSTSYRKLRSLASIGVHIILGSSPNLITKMFKIQYRAKVLDLTVWLVLAHPIV